jgi:carboxyl-terminal processing protease
MVQSLEDPYSTYMDPKAAIQFKEGLESSLTGIGAEVTMKKGKLTIVFPIKGSPAEKAGILPSDQVLKVNGKRLDGLDTSEAVSKIRGPKGSKARLEILRPGSSDTIRVTVIRDEIPIQTVHASLDGEKIGKITLTQFSEGTAKDFKKSLRTLEEKGLKRLVVDVRGNPGGLLSSVLEICDELIGGKKTIVQTEDSNGKRKTYEGKNVKGKSYPIAVLINKGSASASEILAAALKEAEGYPVVGETSFGKGTVQTPEEFEDGSSMKLTVGKWLTPKGNWIDQHGGSKGIKPTHKVKAPSYLSVFPPQPNRVMKEDENSGEVKAMQTVLDTLGYTPGRTDGYFDARTSLAVKAFQKNHNLHIHGRFDQKTAKKLYEAFLKMRSNPKNDLPYQVAKEVVKKQINK